MVDVKALLPRVVVALGSRPYFVALLVTLAVTGNLKCGEPECITDACDTGGEGGSGASTGGPGGEDTSTTSDGTGAEGGTSSSAGGSESSTSTTGGSGGASTSGSGGTGGCEPNGNTCENAPQGSCADVDDGCGVLDCTASCGPPDTMSCVDGACQCDPDDGVQDLDVACEMAHGDGWAGFNCTGAPSSKVPLTCQFFGSVDGQNFYCCPK